MTQDRPIIRGEKVWLRGYRDSDLEPYERFVNSQDAQLAGYGLPTSLDKVSDWYAHVVRPDHGKNGYYFVVSPLGSDDFIGTTWVWNFGSRIGGAELSIYMAEPGRWGTGLGTDATNATLDFVFGFTDIHRVWLATHVTNVRAQRSFAKSGFQPEGTIRQYVRHKGQMVDGLLMSVLRDDWAAFERSRSWDLGESQ